MFSTLTSLADFCETPEELLAWNESREGLGKYDVAALESGYATLAIKALRKIAKKDDKYELVPMPETEGNWGEKFWGGK